MLLALLVMTLEEAHVASKGVSKCEKNRTKLCKFLAYYEDQSALAEECTFCGKRIAYNKVDGRIDNAKYLHDHVRDFLQPHGRTANLFWFVYGQEGFDRIKKLSKAKKPIPSVDDIRDEARSVYKTVKSLIDSGKKVT